MTDAAQLGIFPLRSLPEMVRITVLEKLEALRDRFPLNGETAQELDRIVAQAKIERAHANRLAESLKLALSDNHCTPDTDKVLREALAAWEMNGGAK